MARTESSGDYHDYVIKDGRFIGEFEQMYRAVEDPWHCSALAGSLDNDVLIAAIRHVAGEARRVLEVGCGTGHITRRLCDALPGAEIHACDVAPAALAKAKRLNPSCEFFSFDLLADRELPFAPGTVDLIVMAQVMWYILPALDRTLARFARTLRPNGHLVLAQAFYPSDVQQYGRGVLETTSDAIRYVTAAGLALRSEIHLDPSREAGRPHNSIFIAVRA